ncbi:MAG: hypothetical protein ACLUAR_17750 [Pilosibacter sp.]
MRANRHLQVSGEFLPFDQMGILKGTLQVVDLKAQCEIRGSVSQNTWQHFYGLSSDRDGREEPEKPAALQFPVDLSFFDSETLANFLR